MFQPWSDNDFLERSYKELLIVEEKWWHSGKESACQCRRCKRLGFHPWVWKIPWRRKQQPAPVFLPGKSHEQRSLADYSPRGHKESDMTGHTHAQALGAMLRLFIQALVNEASA